MATREETKRMIEVMQGYAEGKLVETKLDEVWVSCQKPTWQWKSGEYRLKPEPRRVWVNIYDTLNGGNIAHNSEIKAFKDAASYATEVAVEFVEVIKNDT